MAGADLLAGELVGADALHERDGVRVQLVGLVGQVHNGKRHSEPQPLQITHLGGCSHTRVIALYP